MPKNIRGNNSKGLYYFLFVAQAGLMNIYVQGATAGIMNHFI